MILRSIHVAGWRCFVEDVEIGPLRKNLNVLYGPNGSGKSTLFEALCRGLLDAHRVSGREVEAIRPWGRSLSPQVVIEFAHKGTEYRVTKQFLDGASSVLERRENGRFRRLAESDAADRQVREILTQNPPGRGLARLENWGLAQVLWAPQGQLVLEKLSGDLLVDIQTSLGVQVSAAAGVPLEDRLEELYLQFFTTSGKLRTGKNAPAVVRFRGALEKAREKRQSALETQQAFEESARRVEGLRARRIQARHDADELTKALKEARKRAEEYKELLSQQEQRRERAKSSEAQHKKLKQHIDLIDTVTTRLSETRESVQRLEGENGLKESEVENWKQESAKRKAALENARSERRQVDKTQQEAELASRYVAQNNKLTELDELIEKLKEGQQTLSEITQERNELLAPDKKALQAIRRALKTRDEAQVHIEASLITLEIVPEKDGIIEVVAAEQTGKRQLSAEKPLQIKGSPEVVADLPGVARLRAWGPTGSIEEYRSKRDKAEEKLESLTTPYDTADLEQLEALAEKAKELEKRIAKEEIQIETLLSGKSIEGIEQERALVKAGLAKITERHSEWEQSPPDGEKLKVAAEEMKESFHAKIEDLEASWEKTQTALTASTEQMAKLSTQLEESKKQTELLESRLAELTKDGKQPAERERELQEIALSWDAAKARLGKIESQLAPYEDDPIAIVDKLEKQQEGANQASTKALEEEKNEEGKLEQLAAQGPYSVLALAEEEIASLGQEVSREQLRVAAVRLLRDVVVECRTEAVAAVAGPVEEAATRTFHRIAGRRLGRLKLGETFEPTEVHPESSDLAVSLASVSGGEEEQIHLATRLALADVLAQDERQFVVLDDVLTATDAGRLARVMTILEEAAQRLQILILTCHPERYRGLEEAQFLDLEAILRSSGGS